MEQVNVKENEVAVAEEKVEKKGLLAKAKEHLPKKETVVKAGKYVLAGAAGFALGYFGVKRLASGGSDDYEYDVIDANEYSEVEEVQE